MKDWKTGSITIKELIRLARGLIEPGSDCSNPEYERAMVELIVDAAGLPMDDRSLVARAIGVKEPK